jgi:glycosyltransferase involved in cell wall biosynthesis
MKTIAIVINTSWNIYNFRLGLLEALRDEGYRVVLIAPRDDYSQKLMGLGFEYHEIKINNKGTNPFQDLLLVWGYYRLYKKLSLDVVLQYTIKPNIYGTLGAKLAGVAAINNISGLGTVFLNNGLSSKIARFLYRFSLRFANKVFFQNPHDRKLFVDKKLVKENKTGLLPGSGINLSDYKPSLNNLNTDPFVFLFVARLIKDKGIVEFVEAAKELLTHCENHVEFWLLGDLYEANPTAISQDQLDEWTELAEINYLGHVDDVISVMNKANCVVLPSYREGLSRVLLEAAALAKPIITTDVPGCKDVVDDGVNGFLCEVKNSHDLSIQMNKILVLDSQQLQEMGKKGRAKIENEFDEEIVINSYLREIKPIVS